MRDSNIHIFEETMNICKSGSYDVNGKSVFMKLSHDEMEEVIALSPDTLDNMITKPIENSVDHPYVIGRTYVDVENKDSYEVVDDIVSSYEKQEYSKVLVLNFANPVHPGGGVTTGARAQEEDLCRKSTLYCSLITKEAKKMYDFNYKRNDYLASDYMLLSPKVEIIRDSYGKLVSDTKVIGVLTAAAPMVNRGNITATDEEIAKLLRIRIRKIFHVAAHYGYKYLVLGAWGCGAFGNDAKVVAELFYSELKEFKKNAVCKDSNQENMQDYNQDNSFFRVNDCFKKIIFGVLDRTQEQYNYKCFEKYFKHFYADEELTEHNICEKNKNDMDFEFRDILQEEADQAVTIEHICFPPNEACSEKNMKERIAIAPELFLVAVDRETGKLAGFLNGLATDESAFRDDFFTDAKLYNPNGKNIMIMGLDVLPEYRNRGLARELVNQYVRRESKKGRKMLILTCLESKVKMYEKMGFYNQGIAGSTWGDEQWYEMSRKI